MLRVDPLAERLEVGYVRVLVVRDVRDHHPVARQVRAADLLDLGKGDALDLAVALVVDRRPRRESRQAGAAAGDGALRRPDDVVARDAAVAAAALDAAELDTELARQAESQRRR